MNKNIRRYVLRSGRFRVCVEVLEQSPDLCTHPIHSFRMKGKPDAHQIGHYVNWMSRIYQDSANRWNRTLTIFMPCEGGGAEEVVFEPER